MCRNPKKNYYGSPKVLLQINRSKTGKPYICQTEKRTKNLNVDFFLDLKGSLILVDRFNF